MDLAAAAFYFLPFLFSKITCKGNIYNSYMQTFFHFFYTFCDFLYVFLCFLMKIAAFIGCLLIFLSFLRLQPLNYSTFGASSK